MLRWDVEVTFHCFVHDVFLFANNFCVIHQNANLYFWTFVSHLIFNTPPFYQDIPPFIHPSFHPSILPSIHLSIHPSIYLSIHPYIHPSIHPFSHFYLFIKSSSSHQTFHPSILSQSHYEFIFLTFLFIHLFIH